MTARRKRTVRMGVIGIGGMGAHHARYVQGGCVSRCELTAVCDADASALRAYDGVPNRYTDSRELIRSGLVDAVLVATPHYSHTDIGIDALRNGLHVLVEKPVSVHKADCERLLAAHQNRRLVFGAMFNQRTEPCYRKVKALVEKGELGRLMRVNWIITNWFRTQHYFDAGTWRATWKGEGGGVLLNQCPHQLDLLVWFAGMPRRVWGFCGLGRYHDIEVEDDVTAYLEYEGGATGVFVTSTGEAPGVNRLEIAGEMGNLVVEDGRIRLVRNEVSCRTFCRKARKAFAAPEVWNVEIPTPDSGGQHAAVTQNFVDAILDGTPLVAPASEGLRSVELGNAILYSSLTGKAVDLPLDGKAYERLLKRLIRGSKVRKKTRKAGRESLSGTFNTP